jgi:LacI family transcriptional regulator
MPKRNISIKEISALSGVSVATVSRVINQNGRFSSETEKRVKQIIEQYGYQPNQLARGLRTNKLQVVGIIVPDITNEFFAKVTLELQNNLFELNYSTMICNTNEEYDIERRHTTMLKSQQVSGLIYISGDFADEQQVLQVPTVYIDRKPPFSSREGEFVLIESDNENGGVYAADELMKSGARHFAALTYRFEISSHADRVAGFRRGLKAHGVPESEIHVAQAVQADAESGYQRMMELFSEHPEIDGIFCTTDRLAYGLLDLLREQGKSVPGDVRIVGFDDISYSSMCSPRLTTIRQSVNSFGLLGANTLVSILDGAPLERNRYLLPVELIRRDTT